VDSLRANASPKIAKGEFERSVNEYMPRTGGNPLDGKFSFRVVGGQNHDIRVYDGQFNYPKTIFFERGETKMIMWNLEQQSTFKLPYLFNLRKRYVFSSFRQFRTIPILGNEGIPT
jgi:hypothetical protein